MATSAKLEGTSQTYGQLVVLPSNKEAAKPVNSTPIKGPVSPQDVSIKVSKVDDGSSGIDRSKIAIAAATNKDSVITVGSNESGTDTAIVVGSSYKTPEDIKKSLTEAQKVNLSICLHSKQSETIQFNTIKTPELKVEFVYNFFTPDETDIKSQEDQSKDPLLVGDLSHAPRYVHLSWNPSKLTNPLSQVEKAAQSSAKNLLQASKGVVSTKGVVKNSYQQSLKKTDLVNDNGTKKQVVDVHQLDKAFDATANKKVFSNSITAVVNVSDQSNTLASIPVK